MIQLSNASDKAIRAQVAESISLIAKVDFPEQWPDLVDVSTFAISHFEKMEWRLETCPVATNVSGCIGSQTESVVFLVRRDLRRRTVTHGARPLGMHN